ncbi:unnamed protein product [Mycena citricolor]|uniref:Pseudouridine synthase I TruA alpha/beta domain-containing protein n=1 Tax=Mycena citricolor TaxID=2018698 RepID=A0AAD2JXE4_9AGAR|nr:unnamed protein product [Mycena citricolor]
MSSSMADAPAAEPSTGDKRTFPSEVPPSLFSDMEMADTQAREDTPDAKRAKTEQQQEQQEGTSAATPAAPGKKLTGKERRQAKNMQGAGRRKREGKRDYTRPEGSADAAEGDAKDKTPRLPKRMTALLLGYCGSGYHGLQIQKDGTGVTTIENTLFDALTRAGAVSQDNANDPTKVGIARAARTDAGVHAAGNVVALKMITEVPGVPDMVVRVNEELPPEIRLWGLVRVQNSFNPRTNCDSRKYTYFFPTYLLIPPKPSSALYRVLTEHTASFNPPVPPPILGHSFWDAAPADSAAADDMARKRAWRVGPEQMEQLRAGARKYLATHNFHNFTVDGAFNDRSNMRVMKAIDIADPVVYGETEWINVLFHGQSFMMHQIRKMISALVLSVRTGTPADVIDELYGPRDIFIPKMPALGLLLEEPLFDSYNQRLDKFNEKHSPGDPDYRLPIDFEPFHAQIAAFKQKYIYDNMRMVEDRDGLYDAWIRNVDDYAGNDLLYLNPKGVIPSAAVVRDRRDRHRKGGFKEKRLFDATSFPTGGKESGAVDDEDVEAESKTAEVEG